MTAESVIKVKKKRDDKSKLKMPIDKALSSTVGKKKKGVAGRPQGKKKAEALDLITLKQAFLLDNVEELIKDQQAKEQVEAGVKELVVPYTPSYDQQLIHDLIAKHKYGVAVLHRGFGKSYLAVNELIRAAWTCTAPSGGIFIYVAPEKAQAKAVIWDKLKFFVRDLPCAIHEAELTVTFPNRSKVMLAGADNPDRLRGLHPHAVVLDEVGQMSREVWYGTIYPALGANRGSALFIGTPKGDNLFRELYEHAQRTKGWFHCLKGVYDTRVFDAEQIEEFKMNSPPALFEQERLCSFTASMQGTYFGDIIDDEARNIVGDVPWDPSTPVVTGWDLGTTDSTVIWFVQRDPKDSKLVKVIDYYSNKEKDIFHYIQYLKTKPYIYDYHIMPHDVTQVSWESGRSRAALFQQHGLNIRIAKRVAVKEGISMAQTLLYTSKFDQTKCSEGLSHLRQYRAKQDKVTGEFLEEPIHDTHSHAADAFRALAIGLKSSNQSNGSNHAFAISSYDYFNPSTAGRPRHHEADDNYDLFDPSNTYK